MTTNDKLAALRAEMAARGASALMIVSDDFHQSEYVGEYFRARAWVSGFGGSAGTLVITMDEARLFTDGRYVIAAAKALEGSEIALRKSGTPGVPTPTEYLASVLKDGDTLAFDGRCVSASAADALRAKLPTGVSIMSDVDFPGLIWENRPALPCGAIRRYDDIYAGRSHAEKLADVRAALDKKGCTALVMSSLCDIAWFYNLRGVDVEKAQVFLAYCLVTRERDELFVRPGAMTCEPPEGVTVRDYDEFIGALASLENETVLVDKSALSEAIAANITAKTVAGVSPTVLMKAKKNETELANTRKAHLSDGLAVTRFMIELKYGSREFDEISAAAYLLALRRECAERIGVHMVGESFGAISAFGPNAAIVHYGATRESCRAIDRTAPVPMLLMDSGGQYLEGTTDITRTFVLGAIPAEVKAHYTLVAAGMLRLANARFPEGASGKALDAICRMPLWQAGLDFLHGTGHGVGHLLSVHEGPNRFHWRTADAVLEVGMITSDEPGLYVEDSHGIRIENELCVIPGGETPFGRFLAFENLTLCPIDLDGIDASLLDASDVRALNEYHRAVFDALAPHLCAGERERLAYLTRAI
ncbi:MAG: aminopeptidase P family protein [Clostridia bacterium]|nr:aminopeptidase P family protein [Clostridia bacterium]